VLYLYILVITQDITAPLWREGTALCGSARRLVRWLSPTLDPLD